MMKPGDRVRLLRTYDPISKHVWLSLRDFIDEPATVRDIGWNEYADGDHCVYVEFDKSPGVVLLTTMTCLKVIEDVQAQMD